MMPWLAPIQDNLQYLMGNDKLTLESYLRVVQLRWRQLPIFEVGLYQMLLL